MATVFREYERRKEASGAIDFEDLLELTVRMYEEDEHALAALRERYAAFTVDEYQDVNLLQQSLLELWLGPRDDVCAVGDDYQSIYGFTGASPEWLLGLATRFPQATVVRLEENYRSSPQVLALANRLVPQLGGAEKTLRATRPEGPEPQLRGFDSPEAEGAFVLSRVRELHAEGVPYEEMAVLIRLNARSVDFEELFADAQVPFQGAALLARDGARQLLEGPARRGLRLAVRGGAAGRGAAGARRRGPGQGRRARARAPGRPRAPLQAGRGVRRRHEDGRAVDRVAARALRPRRRRAASTCSRCTARRGSSSRRSSCRGSRRRSCRARRRCAPPTRSARSGGCSTSA